MYMFIYVCPLVTLFLSALFVYVSKYKHFLFMLLSLEMGVLSLYMLMLTFFSYFVFEYFLGMVFLSMSVCEGVLGLSLLVFVIRSHGSDMLMIFDSLW
uniref:NADH-ubiquinone oxidoreductase chain 4L n=1 Tax=Trigonopterus tanimbarensis TaxID=2678946 RepID=A0A7H1KHS3_9CUCU|nr:NADH dehydrogenase subunit 4L [Trigonopterus tanimbarensis]QNT26839.1 NADH dehydrogenase subunit 4L [Trigonopterus tanimbarensis]